MVINNFKGLTKMLCKKIAQSFLTNLHRLVSMVAILTITGQLSGCATLIPTVVGGTLVSGAVVAAKDRRAAGAYVSDKFVIFDLAEKIANTVPNSHISVASYNRTILLTGEALNENDRIAAETLSREHTEVKKVLNYINIEPASSLSARIDDSLITTKAYCNLIVGKGYPLNQIKIITEQGVVYVMGLLNQQETNAVAEVISKTAGVQQVVMLTEAPQ